MLNGLLAGLAGANVWAVRLARSNRARVEELEAATAHEAQPADPSGRRAYRSVGISPVGPALRKAVAVERRRVLAWLLATVLVTAAGVAADIDDVIVGGVVVVGVLAPIWVLRRLCAAWLALRDFRTAATAPRRAFVILCR